MNEKEIAEIRRRFRPDKSSIERVRGCYVNENKEIISEFNQSLGLMSQDESENLLTLLKKTLSGGLEKNLINIEFSNRQVLEGEEHKLLMSLRKSALADDEAVKTFYDQVIQSLDIEGNYLILLAFDNYDLPSFSKDGMMREDSSGVFSYFLCSICPLKQTKPALSYYTSENRFRNITSDWVVSAPALGFMFPTFDDRTANIYKSLYYSRNIAEHHETFIDAIFKSEVFMPADVQKETFQSILHEAVAEDCSIDVVRSVHAKLSELIEEHKADKEEDPLVINKGVISGVLESCGISETHVTAFEEKFDTEFGADTEISPQNIIDAKKFELSTPDVTIRVNPERSDLVETRVINGVKYILVRADEGVEVNGMDIKIL